MSRKNPTYRAFHGTHHFGPADPPSFEPERDGRVWFGFLSPDEGHSIRRYGIFLTGSKKFAGEFGSRIIPVNVRFKKVADLKNDEEILWRFAESIPWDGPDRDLHLRATPSKGYLAPWEYFDGELGKRFVSWLKENGYDGARFVEYTDVDGREFGATTYVALNRSQVKDGGIGSRNRKVNPGNIRSKIDGLGFHHMQFGKVLLAGGFPDFGRRPTLFMRGPDSKGRHRLKYIIYDYSVLGDITGRTGTMTDAESKKCEAGYCVLLVKDETAVGLIDIVLKPSFRGKGLGEKIIKTLVDECPTDFDVIDVTKNAIGFWKKMGGEPVGNPKDKNWVVRK